MVTSDRAQERPSQATSLVAFFSHTGNTRVIAYQIRRATSSDVFEIIPASDYPEDYEQTVAPARQETLNGFHPERRSQVEPASQYETIYLGFPICGTTAPPPIRSFLAKHDLSGKTIVPFVTHGGYGLGTAFLCLQTTRLKPASLTVSPWRASKSAASWKKSRLGWECYPPKAVKRPGRLHWHCYSGQIPVVS